MALSADTPRNFTVVGRRNARPVQASSTIYAGSALTTDTGGEVGPFSASEVSFAGFAVSKVDNSAGSAGDVKADVITEGEIELIVTGVGDNDDHDDKVYATDDNTFTLTASGALAIGRVTQITDAATGKCRVHFSAASNEHPLD